MVQSTWPRPKARRGRGCRWFRGEKEGRKSAGGACVEEGRRGGREEVMFNYH